MSFEQTHVSPLPLVMPASSGPMTFEERARVLTEKSRSHIHLADLDPTNPHVLDQVVGHVMELATNQNGSRFLQDRLDERQPPYLDIVFDEILEFLPELMVNLFGNYLCQKVITYSSAQQQMLILQKLSPDFIRVVCDRQGTRASQKLVELCASNSSHRDTIMQICQSDWMLLMMNANATHLVHVILDTFPSAEVHSIFEDALTHVCDLANDQHGLCILKKCLSLSHQANPMHFDAMLHAVRLCLCVPWCNSMFIFAHIRRSSVRRFFPALFAFCGLTLSHFEITLVFHF